MCLFYANYLQEPLEPRLPLMKGMVECLVWSKPLTMYKSARATLFGASATTSATAMYNPKESGPRVKFDGRLFRVRLMRAQNTLCKVKQRHPYDLMLHVTMPHYLPPTPVEITTCTRAPHEGIAQGLTRGYRTELPQKRTAKGHCTKAGVYERDNEMGNSGCVRSMVSQH